VLALARAGAARAVASFAWELSGSVRAGGGPQGLVARRLTRPQVARHVAVIHRQERSLSPAAQAFADLLVAEFG
jgi:DNA-binding transcriptional LysR family regulator